MSKVPFYQERVHRPSALCFIQDPVTVFSHFTAAHHQGFRFLSGQPSSDKVATSTTSVCVGPQELQNPSSLFSFVICWLWLQAGLCPLCDTVISPLMKDKDATIKFTVNISPLIGN